MGDKTDIQVWLLLDAPNAADDPILSVCTTHATSRPQPHACRPRACVALPLDVASPTAAAANPPAALRPGPGCRKHRRPRPPPRAPATASELGRGRQLHRPRARALRPAPRPPRASSAVPAPSAAPQPPRASSASAPTPRSPRRALRPAPPVASRPLLAAPPLLPSRRGCGHVARHQPPRARLPRLRSPRPARASPAGRLAPRVRLACHHVPSPSVLARASLSRRGHARQRAPSSAGPATFCRGAIAVVAVVTRREREKGRETGGMMSG
nr:translation initiation factor IF-2-like [Aegilops tauschii subsp. strangulata]